MFYYLSSFIFKLQVFWCLYFIESNLLILFHARELAADTLQSPTMFLQDWVNSFYLNSCYIILILGISVLYPVPLFQLLSVSPFLCLSTFTQNLVL